MGGIESVGSKCTWVERRGSYCLCRYALVQGSRGIECIYIYMYVYTYIHTHIHTYIHTYTHTYTRILRFFWHLLTTTDLWIFGRPGVFSMKPWRAPLSSQGGTNGTRFTNLVVLLIMHTQSYPYSSHVSEHTHILCDCYICIVYLLLLITVSLPSPFTLTLALTLTLCLVSCILMCGRYCQSRLSA